MHLLIALKCPSSHSLFSWAFIWRVAIIYVTQLGFCLQALGGRARAEEGKEPRAWRIAGEGAASPTCVPALIPESQQPCLRDGGARIPPRPGLSSLLGSKRV